VTDEGYRARLFCIEWHANLWRIHGTPIEWCEAMRHHCSEILDADYYGEPRPQTDDPELHRMERYLDRVFSSPFSGLVSYE
jgi:hypothetical protein